MASAIFEGMDDGQPTIDALNEQFALGERARFVAGPNGLPTLAFRTDLAEADLMLYGGHVTHFQPVGGDPVLYLSPISHFAPGEPIRGGIPICFPWFADHADRPDLPPHGFVRLLPWEPLAVEQLPDGRVRAQLSLSHEPGEETEGPAAAFEHAFRLTLTVTVGRSLALALTIENPAAEPLPCEIALHSYFRVADVRRVQVLGLEGADYLDKTDDFRRKTQPRAPVTFTRETDRVYLDTHADCRIIDVPGRRHLLIGKTGSNTTVVWNPWVDKARTLDDLADHDWPQLACIETANVGPNALSIPAGAAHEITTTIHTQSLA